MSGHAEIVGIEEHLTVPSRRHTDFVDVWMTIRWSESCREWTTTFEALAAKQHLELLPSGSLQVSALSESQGWIIARAIGGDRRRRAEVETLMRRLVDQTNRLIGAPCADAEPAEIRVPWADRVRSRFASLSSVGAGLLASRRTRDADVASST